jgi:AAA domain-containing protein
MDLSTPSLVEAPVATPIALDLPPPPPPEPAANQTALVKPALLWGSAELAAAVAQAPSWLWYGYLAPGSVTLLTSLWKSGKTTLVSVLLSRLKTGGQLAGLALAAGKAVVLSEERPAHWLDRDQRLGFGDAVGWYCQPFQGKPTPAQWSAFVDDLVAEHVRRGFTLLVIDPLADFIAGTENDVGCVLGFLLPLQRLTRRGVAVLLLHHPSQERSTLGRLARGSGALSGSADILIEMRLYPGAAEDDRRRWLQAFSRFQATPRQLVIEWTADGTDYQNLGDLQEEDFASHWRILRAQLSEARRKLKRAEIYKQWPDEERLDRKTLTRWLERAVGDGWLAKDGEGTNEKPYRYWLPERVEAWLKDPLAMVHMPELFARPDWLLAQDALYGRPAPSSPPAEAQPA